MCVSVLHFLWKLFLVKMCVHLENMDSQGSRKGLEDALS